MNVLIKVTKALVASAALLLASHAAVAQDLPKVIRIVVAFQPGGQQDVMARHFASGLAAKLGVTVIVDNKPGASGMLAAEQVAKMPADGSTLMMTTGAAISIAPHLYPKLAYNPTKDFASVAMVGDIPMSIAVRTESPVHTLKDLVQAAKNRPGQITIANTGVGSISHLTSELFAQAAGIKLLNVPYKGVGSIQDLLGGQVDSIMTSAVGLDPLVETGKVRVLGTFTKQRLPASGGAPTVFEALGIKGMEFPVWVGVLAPAATSPSYVQRLGAEIQAICNAPATREKFKGIMSCADGPALTRVIQEDRDRWGNIIRIADIKPE